MQDSRTTRRLSGALTYPLNYTLMIDCEKDRRRLGCGERSANFVEEFDKNPYEKKEAKVGCSAINSAVILQAYPTLECIAFFPAAHQR